MTTETRNQTATRNAAIATVVAIIVGALVAMAGSQGSQESGGVAVFAIVAALAFAINWIAFVPANAAKTEAYYDLTGSITYLTVTLVALTLSSDLDLRAYLAGLLVAGWALRLGTFLFKRIKRDGRDGRFDEIKISPVRFLAAWTVQGLWVLLTAAAALAIITSTAREELGPIGYLALAIWVIGFAIEVVADRQKSAFRSDPANKGRFIQSGLWAWSRHPNYFGEILLWTGMALLAVPILTGWRWVVLISPIFVTLLLTKVSGIPPLERRADEKWGGEAEYEQYKASTPVLIPRPPR